MSFSTTPLSVPIQLDGHGVARIAGTRVTLDSVIAVFKQGATAEDIVESFPTLGLSDVYAVLTFYLRNRSAVEAYLEEQDRQAEEIREQIEKRFNNSGLRERLLARKREKEAGDAAPAG